jgi:hypothetical protein
MKTTVYFDRNVFDHIEKKLGITDDDIGLLRKEVSTGRLSVLVSFEVVAETANASQDTALKGLQLIRELCRQELPIKPHYELLRDDIRNFADGGNPSSPFLEARFSIDRVIADIQNPSPEVSEMIAEEKRIKERLNDDLRGYIEEERNALNGKRPSTFEKYWEARSRYYTESFAHFAGYLEKCKARGIDELLKVKSVRMTVGAFLSLLYSLLEGRAVKNGTSYDLKHAAPMSAADIVVTNDGELRMFLSRVPIPELSVMSLSEFILLLRSGGYDHSAS